MAALAVDAAMAQDVALDATCAPLLTHQQRRLYDKANAGTDVLRQFVFIRRAILQVDVYETATWAESVNVARAGCSSGVRTQPTCKQQPCSALNAGPAAGESATSRRAASLPRAATAWLPGARSRAGGGVKTYTSSMAAPGSGGRLVALPLAWLAGVALQLQQRELLAARHLSRPGDHGRGHRGRAGGVLIARSGVIIVAPWRDSRWREARRRCASPRPCRPRSRVATSSSPASSPTCRSRGRAGCAFASRSTRAALRRACRAFALGWYAGFHEDAALVQPRLALRAGQRWRFTVRLRQPHGNLNPHGFDYELTLLEQGVRATGYVRDAPAHCSTPVPVIRSSGCASASATRSTRTSTTAASPASLRRSRSAIRARSSATTGTCSAIPAWPT